MTQGLESCPRLDNVVAPSPDTEHDSEISQPLADYGIDFQTVAEYDAVGDDIEGAELQHAFQQRIE